EAREAREREAREKEAREKAAAEAAAKAAAAKPPEEQISAKEALDRGTRSFRGGDLDQAIKYAKQALKQDPSLSSAHKLLAGIYVQQGKHCDAKVHYQRFMELDPNSPLITRTRQILQNPEFARCQ
ncbi:MAG: tetratricopeptide repeat protein, partial [Myxococcota bacterium]